MARSLSDLRRRVVEAIAGGLSCRAAASGLASARRARSDGGPRNGARATSGPSARAATAIRNGSRRMPS